MKPQPPFFPLKDMLNLLRSFLFEKSTSSPVALPNSKTSTPTDIVLAPSATPFSVAAHIDNETEFPVLGWQAAHLWIESIPDADARGAAWARLERAWLEHMESALGAPYAVHESETSLLLSTLDQNVADATLDFMSKSLQRIIRVLDGIAEVSEWGKDILVVFDDEAAYYRYVSQYYPADGEFAASSGMYINAGCGHFATVKADLQAIEPIIVHEMTHACLSHLPIPAWLNEGLAVNTEHRLSPSGAPRFTPREMHARHRAFWGDTEIQEFWSGKSFLRNDDGNMLSYDLARILVSQLSADWPSFRSFVLSANIADAGAAAAMEHLDLDLGAAASALLEREPTDAWAPNPALWLEEPERGAF